MGFFHFSIRGCAIPREANARGLNGEFNVFMNVVCAKDLKKMFNFLHKSTQNLLRRPSPAVKPGLRPGDGPVEPPRGESLVFRCLFCILSAQVVGVLWCCSLPVVNASEWWGNGVLKF